MLKQHLSSVDDFGVDVFQSEQAPGCQRLSLNLEEETKDPRKGMPPPSDIGWSPGHSTSLGDCSYVSVLTLRGSSIVGFQLKVTGRRSNKVRTRAQVMPLLLDQCFPKLTPSFKEGQGPRKIHVIPGSFVFQPHWNTTSVAWPAVSPRDSLILVVYPADH